MNVSSNAPELRPNKGLHPILRADGERRIIAQERDLVPMVGVRSVSG